MIADGWRKAAGPTLIAAIAVATLAAPGRAEEPSTRPAIDPSPLTALTEAREPIDVAFTIGDRVECGAVTMAKTGDRAVRSRTVRRVVDVLAAAPTPHLRLTHTGAVRHIVDARRTADAAPGDIVFTRGGSPNALRQEFDFERYFPETLIMEERISPTEPLAAEAAAQRAWTAETNDQRRALAALPLNFPRDHLEAALDNRLQHRVRLIGLTTIDDAAAYVIEVRTRFGPTPETIAKGRVALATDARYAFDRATHLLRIGRAETAYYQVGDDAALVLKLKRIIEFDCARNNE